MEHERLTEELLHELLDAPTVDSFLGSHELPDISLSDYLQQLLEEKTPRTRACGAYGRP